MSFLTSLTSWLGHVLALYGGLGLVAISFFDSSFMPMPSVNDLLLIHLSIRFPNRVPIYAFEATLGSILGAYVMYALGYGGRAVAARRSPPEKAGRVRKWVERNDFVALLVASLLPPPAPFKIFLVTAGALKIDLVRFGVALLVGRGARFLIEGWLAARYGAAAEAYLKANIVCVSFLAVALVVVIALLYRRLRGPAAKESASPGPSR